VSSDDAEHSRRLAQIHDLGATSRTDAENRWAEVFERWAPGWQGLSELAAFYSIAGPDGRNGHLAVLDKVLLPPLEDQQLSFSELCDLARSRPTIDVLTAETRFAVPILWRWLLDARRRRLVEPVGTGEPRVDTPWDLTAKGNRRLLGYATRARILAARARVAIGPAAAAVALLASVLGGAVVINYVNAFAPVMIVIALALVFILGVDAYDHWSVRRAQERQQREGVRVTDPWDGLVEFALVFEAALQEQTRETPGATLRLEPPEPATQDASD